MKLFSMKLIKQDWFTDFSVLFNRKSLDISFQFESN